MVRTPVLEIRYAGDELLTELADLAAGGIHEPGTMPFSIPWTLATSPQLERSSLKFWWGQRASWSPDRWQFTGAVIVKGRPVGVQDLMAENFSTTRSVSTGSWLGAAFQRQGIGKEMRSAILHLAFEGLGAAIADSSAFEDNVASLATSRALGYVDNGDEVVSRLGRPARMVRLKLARGIWGQQRRDDIEVLGLDRCREWFGA